MPRSWCRWPVCLWPFCLLRGICIDYHLPLRCSGQHKPCFVVILSRAWGSSQCFYIREQHDAQLLITTDCYFTLPFPCPVPGQCRCLHLNMVHEVSACAMLAVGQPVWFWEHLCPLGLNRGSAPSAAPQEQGMTQGLACRAQSQRVLPPACLHAWLQPWGPSVFGFVVPTTSCHFR